MGDTAFTDGTAWRRLTQAEEDSATVIAVKILAVLVLASLSAIFSGLNLGLMCLDENQLVMLINAAQRPGADKEAKQQASWARRILPLRKDGNTLLCTVLLGNVMVNSYMAILLDEMWNGMAAFVASTMIIVTFGEIIPQSLCYKHGLRIGSALTPVVIVFWFALLPVTKPLALVLDKVFGEEIGQVLDKEQILTLVDYQRKQAPHLLTEQEAKILHGSIGFSTTCVESLMVHLDDCFCLDANALVNAGLLAAVADAGFSRIPVISRDMKNPKRHFAVVGLIHVKDLLLIDVNHSVPLKSLLPLFGRDVFVVDSDQPLPEILDEFRQGASQLAVVRSLVDDEDCDPYFRHVGVLTLQDLLNFIVQEDVNEADGAAQNVDLEVPDRMFSNVTEFHTEPMQIRSRGSDLQIRLQGLSNDETIAAAAFLLRRYPNLFRQVSHEALEAFLQCDCRMAGGRPVEAAASSQPDQALYRKGEAAAFAALVVTGEVKVFSGNDTFESIHGPWSLLGKLCLEYNSEDTDLPSPSRLYVPDFSAYTAEAKEGANGTRLLIITSQAHRQLLMRARKTALSAQVCVARTPVCAKLFGCRAAVIQHVEYRSKKCHEALQQGKCPELPHDVVVQLDEEDRRETASKKALGKTRHWLRVLPAREQVNGVVPVNPG